MIAPIMGRRRRGGDCRDRGHWPPAFALGPTLLSFFFSSSKLTQLCEERKAVDEDFKQVWLQVPSRQRPMELAMD